MIKIFEETMKLGVQPIKGSKPATTVLSGQMVPASHRHQSSGEVKHVLFLYRQAFLTVLSEES